MEAEIKLTGGTASFRRLAGESSWGSRRRISALDFGNDGACVAKGF
jgi:hypothetical protein